MAELKARSKDLIKFLGDYHILASVTSRPTDESNQPSLYLEEKNVKNITQPEFSV
jgi:hypothetical protein